MSRAAVGNRNLNAVANLFKLAGFVIAGLVLWFWDEVIFVAPIAGVVALVGPLWGWVIMAIIYFLLFFTLSFLTLRSVKRGRNTRFTNWISEKTDQAKTSKLYPLIASGSALAFIASCFVLGGLITSHIISRLGLWRKVSNLQIALVSNLCFACVWVGFYSGAFGLIINIIKQVF